MSEKQLDILERVFWTAVQASVAVLAVHAANLDPLWVAPATALLSFVKSYAASRIKGSADLPVWAKRAVKKSAKKVTKKAVKEVQKRSK